MFTKNQITEIMDLLVTLDENTKIYLGCDSVKYLSNKKVSMAKFASVCIIHMNGNKGCRIFSNLSYERDYDMKPSRPKMRMMNEVIKVSALYNQLAPFIDEFDVEIHIDVNTDPKHGSNCAAAEAAGYVLGMTGIEPKLKPAAFAASVGADGVAHGRGN